MESGRRGAGEHGFRVLRAVGRLLGAKDRGKEVRAVPGAAKGHGCVKLQVEWGEEKNDLGRRTCVMSCGSR